MRLEQWTSAEKNLFAILNFFKILLFLLKRKFSFHSVPFICRLFKSETSPNFSILISKIFWKKLKILTVMTSFWRNDDVIGQLNYTKLISLWFSITPQNFIPFISLIILELWAAGTFRHPPTTPPGRATLKKPWWNRVRTKESYRKINALLNSWPAYMLIIVYWRLVKIPSYIAWSAFYW